MDGLEFYLFAPDALWCYYAAVEDQRCASYVPCLRHGTTAVLCHAATGLVIHEPRMAHGDPDCLQMLAIWRPAVWAVLHLIVHLCELPQTTRQGLASSWGAACHH